MLLCIFNYCRYWWFEYSDNWKVQVSTTKLLIMHNPTTFLSLKTPAFVPKRLVLANV